MVARLEKKVQEILGRIDPKVARAFWKRFDLFLDNPQHPLLKNHPLKGEWNGYRSINITGDWRAIYFQVGENIIFVDLGTHSQLYR